MKILRSILAVVAGFIVSAMVTFAIQQISHRMYPLPEGTDTSDMEALSKLLPTMPIGALLMVLFSWEFGAFIGGAVAALIAGRARCWHAGIVGGLVLASTITVFFMLRGHPEWMIVAGLLLPLPVSLLAGKLVSLLVPTPTSPGSNP
jgi:hypothetical protein